jgi:hypothetical protein
MFIMRVSSATASLDSRAPISRTGLASGASRNGLWSHVKRQAHKLDRFMTAIAHAEAGNLDAVQEILDENRPVRNSQHRSAGNGGIEWQ